MFRLTILGVLSFVFIAACTDDFDKGLIGNHHAIWSESIYLRGHRPSTQQVLQDGQCALYRKLLGRHGIRYSYMFSGPFSVEGFVPEYSYSDRAAESLSVFSRGKSNLLVLPWLGGVQNKTVFLDDPVWQANAVVSTRELVDSMGYSGVHIDVEFLLNSDSFIYSDISPLINYEQSFRRYDDDLISFHRRLREALQGYFISTVVVSTASDTRPWKKKISIEKVVELVKYVDQIVFLFYDTAIDSQEIFDKNCREQVEHLIALRKLYPNVQLLLAIGTFENHPALRKYRKIDIEIMENTVESINQALWELEASDIVDGLAIFADWTTSRDEWRRLRKLLN